MQAEKRTFREGWNWLLDGLAIYRKSPAALAMLTLGFFLLVMVVNSLPMIGPLAGSLLMPFLSVGMMNACRRIDQGETPAFDVLFSAFRQSPRTLVALGALYLSLSVLVLMLTRLVDDGTLMAFMTGGRVEAADLQKPETLLAVQLGLVLMFPVVAAFWYAPMLAAWHGTQVGKSLFFSLVAVMRNWAAFLGYGLSTFVYGVFFPSLVISLAAMFIESQALLLALVGAPLLLVLGPTLFGTFYVSYRDVFVSQPAPQDASPAPHVDSET